MKPVQLQVAVGGEGGDGGNEWGGGGGDGGNEWGGGGGDEGNEGKCHSLSGYIALIYLINSSKRLPDAKFAMKIFWMLTSSWMLMLSEEILLISMISFSIRMKVAWAISVLCGLSMYTGTNLGTSLGTSTIIGN